MKWAHVLSEDTQVIAGLLVYKQKVIFMYVCDVSLTERIVGGSKTLKL